jgi:putative transposase
MKYLTQKRSRHLPDYDYSQHGIYSVTIVTKNRLCLFGDVIDNQMVLNDIGKIVRGEWLKSEQIRKEIRFDQWIIMPNHIHGIIFIDEINIKIENKRASHATASRGCCTPGRKPRSLSTFVSGFKAAVSRRVNIVNGTESGSIWQYNYYDHIIHDEDDLNIRRQYIMDNPQKWEQDRLSPEFPISHLKGHLNEPLNEL